MNIWSRRTLLKLASSVLPLQLFSIVIPHLQASVVPEPASDLYPTQPPELAREIVTVSHFDLKRVQELVSARPSLARAGWDWGFGDWETPLDAASHMGNRPIAEYLISQGARPTLFSATMLGQLEVVKAFLAAQPGVQRIRGPHSITLLAHAKAGGNQAREVYNLLQQLGDADEDPPAPPSANSISTILGTYAFGIGANQQVDVTMEQGKLTWTRKGMMGRWLVPAGELAFYPIGAPSVRIRFAEASDTVMMSVYDPDLVLTARRRKAAM